MLFGILFTLYAFRTTTYGMYWLLVLGYFSETTRSRLVSWMFDTALVQHMARQRVTTR